MQKNVKVKYVGVWLEARNIIWKSRRRLLIGSLLMLVSRLSGMVLPASTKILGDEIFVKGDFSWLKWVAIAIGIASLIQSSTGFLLSQILGVAAHRAISEMRMRVQAKVENLPISYFDSTQSGQLISRIMNDADGIRNLVGTGMGQIVGSFVTTTIALCVLFYLNWRLTLTITIALAFFGGVLSFAFKKLRPIIRNRSVITSEVIGRLNEGLSGIRIVKTYKAEKREKLSFARGAHRMLRNVSKTVTGVSAITAFSSIINGFIGVMIVLIGGNAVYAGTMTLGDYLMYISFTALLAMPIIELTSVGTQITEAFAGLDRIHEILSMKTEDEDDNLKRSLSEVAGTIEFQDVYFDYKTGIPVLKGISFYSEAGMTTALVGSSGSGKSTILSLVLNFIQPTSGQILIDGKDLKSIKLKDYRSFLGAVLQDNFLFDGTIYDNVRFSKPTARFEEVKEVCRIANAEEFIEKFPDRYNTIVGERGVKLSGGQRQRIAIARALLANPRILILDEATSSLDSESEALIQESLTKLRKGRTTFVIAHRLSTIRSADQILVVEAGEIVEHGTHQELLAKNNRYKELYDKQYQYEKNLYINPGEDFTSKKLSSRVKLKPKYQK